MLIIILECVYAATSSMGEEERVRKICIKGKKISLRAAILIVADDKFLAFLDFYGVIEYGIYCDWSAYRLTFAADGQFVSFG